MDVSQVDGSIYYAGSTLSSIFPTHNAMQNANTGGFDGIAIKFDSTCYYPGAAGWATYYGTSSPSFASYQYFEAGALDAYDNFFLGGRTTHFGGVNIAFANPQPAGAFVDTTYGGGSQDAMFVELSHGTGALLWSTFYGGAGSTFETVHDMTFDGNGNLYAVLAADTSTPRMIETGAYNNGTKNGGMILKFDSALVRKWATCFSTKNGTTNRISFESSTGNYFVTGQAKDTLNWVDPGGGAYMDTTLTGASDTYIARLNSSDSVTWATYYGGSSAEDGVAIKVYNGELYLAGTTSSNNFPFYYTGPAYIDSVLEGSSDMFIARFKTSCQRTWSTYYGGNSTDAPAQFAFDSFGNMFLAGNIYSSNFYTLNPFNNIYYNGTYGGGSHLDVVLLSFNALNQLKWSTYFGGLQDDHTTLGLGIYQNEWLYLCGYTGTRPSDSPNFPITSLSGAYFQSAMNSSAITNGFMCRFDLDPTFTVGINEQEYTNATGNSGLFVYPNPGDGEFHVLVNSETKKREIDVYNTLGQLLQNVPVSDGMASQVISLNLREQPAGVYFIVLKDETGTCSKKIIKQ